MSRSYVLIAALVMISTIAGGAYFKGRTDGVNAEAARNLLKVQELNKQLADLDRQLAELETERLEREAELQRRVEELTEEANADPDATRPAIGAGSVRRLNSITGD